VIGWPRVANRIQRQYAADVLPIYTGRQDHL